MKEKVLITGASGFIGYHLVTVALSRGLQVDAAVRKTSKVDHLRGLPVQLVELQYDNPDLLQKQLKEASYQYVIHAGGATRAFDQVAYDVANVGSTTQLSNALRGVVALKKMVLISSLAALGPQDDFDTVITEATTPRPVTAYGKSKLTAELSLRQAPFPWVIIRPTAVYGPREKDLLKLMRSVNKGWDVYISKTAQRLSFVYVKDLAEVIINALLGPVHNEDFNISDGRSYNRYELADITKQYTHKKASRFHLPYGLVKAIAFLLQTSGRATGRVPVLNVEKLNELTAVNWNCSIDKAKRLLHYQPAFELEQGLSETIDWYKKHQWL